MRLRNNQDVASIDEPISAISCSGAHHALCTPIIIDHFKGGEIQDGLRPIGAQTTHDRFSVVQPLVLGQQGGAAARPIDEPCPTISCAGAVRGVFPVLADGRVIDIRMRMLKPSELAAAHSFPADYVITGNRGEQVKQIGNSVPVRTAEAMMAADLENFAA